jgi:Concanavalin A-like lectin/glucanases superfamily
MARLFNGTSQSMEANAKINPGSSFSLAFWLWFDSYSTADQFVFEESANYVNGNAFRVSPADSVTGAWGLGIHTTNGFSYGSIARPTAAAWHHYVLTVQLANPTAVTAYVDGVAKTFTFSLGPQNDTGQNFDNDFLFCMARNNFSNWAAGRLAEVAFWNGVVLTAAEAAILGLGYAPPLVRPASLSLYWPLLTGQSPEIELVAQNGFNLTGSPTNTPHPAVLYPIAFDEEAASAGGGGGGGTATNKSVTLGRHALIGGRACSIGRHALAA